MKLEIVPYQCMCELRTFRINGVKANYEDFVTKYDHDRDNAPDYGCGDMRCDEKEPTPEVLAKYGITLAEHREIVDRLSNALDFGRCADCE